MKAIEVADRLEKAPRSFRHGDINDIEVPLATKAASQVYAPAQGSVEFTAVRAPKGNPVSARLRRDPQVSDDDEHVDVVSQRA